MANEEQDEAASLSISFVMSRLWHKRDAQRRVLHRVVYFFNDGGDNNSNIVSFHFQVTTPGKNLKHAQNAKSNSPRASAVYVHV